MANNKLLLSITTSAIIASAFVAAEETSAASYKVQSGDSLWSIAQKFDTSISKLKSINKLSSSIIFPNQVLETEKKHISTKPNSTTNTSTNNTTTYTVKRGDTLSAIAFKHNISLAELIKLNELDSTLIYPGNVLRISATNGDSSSGSDSSSSNTGDVNNDLSEQVTAYKVYTIKSGDTLSRIATRNSVTVAELKKWNKLKSDLIFIGQKLNIGGSAADDGSAVDRSDTHTPATDVSYNVHKLISVAKNVNGASYTWGGTTPNGFDCSGFIYYTYTEAGMDISRLSSGGYYNRSFYVNKPVIGDLVFFENTYKKGISHVGIYLGNNKFIHAGSSGVQITSLSNSYWKEHLEGFKRFY